MTNLEIPIDLRSDTITRPDEAMYAAMCSAPLGDDVFGDDPTVIELQNRAAEICGKEGALFVPSGTMGNSIAVGVHCRPGDELIVEGLSHTYNFEQAGTSRLWGVQSRTIDGDRGMIPLESIRRSIRYDDVHLPRTRLVVLEQTSNMPGGCVQPLDYLQEVGELCRERGLRFHIDGARIFNASVASGVPVSEYAACADSMMFCVSKGLGAPAGSLIVGDTDFAAEARRLRKLLGGGLRQGGVIAACGLHALEHNVDRLADDHRHARELGERLAGLGLAGLEVSEPETNMIFIRWSGDDESRYASAAMALAKDGVLTVGLPERGIRVVFHKDIDDAASERSGDLIAARLKQALAG